MEAYKREKLIEALEAARRKAQDVLNRYLGESASRYMIILKVSRSSRGGIDVTVDIEAYRPRDPRVESIVEEAVRTAVAEFNRVYKGESGRRRSSYKIIADNSYYNS